MRRRDKVDAFRDAYAHWGGWIILLKGLTPIPFKIVTITSGFARYPILPFIALSFIARGMRFYAFAFVMNRYGARARAIIEERLGFWFTVGLAVLVAGIGFAIFLGCAVAFKAVTMAEIKGSLRREKGAPGVAMPGGEG